MTTNPHRRENPSTYIVQDRSNKEELARLQIQDQLLTVGMGGVLAEQPDPGSFERVLDIGCGTGGWLIEAAKAYPTMSLLVGVDISKRMVDYARAQAEAEQVADRVEFHMMDALLKLEFPDEYFDLVNMRCAGSFLRTWDWPKLLSEFQRVSRRGAVVRVTEFDGINESSGAAHKRLSQLAIQAFYKSGHFFRPESDGLTSELARLLTQHGIRQVQTLEHPLQLSADTLEGKLFIEDGLRFFRTAKPFLQKWLRLPEDYDAIYQQMFSEMQQPDFATTWRLLTAWGQAPGYDNHGKHDTPS